MLIDSIYIAKRVKEHLELSKARERLEEYPDAKHHAKGEVAALNGVLRLLATIEEESK